MSGRFTLGLLAALVSPLLQAGEPPSPPVACREKVCVSLDDLVSRFEGFPPAVRQQLLDSPEQMEQLLDDMLLRRQLVERAAQLNIESDMLVQARLRAARERVLADETLDRLITKDRPNFDLLAREQYLLNPATHRVGAHRLVQHILVTFEGRTPEEALAIATELRKRAMDGADFGALVRQYSEDPSRVENDGKFEVSPSASLVAEFKDASTKLEKVNDISEPVRTQFGYHLIKYLGDEPGRQLPVDEAVPRIAVKLESEWMSSRREGVLSELRRVGTNYEKEGFEALRERYGD